MNSSKPIGGYFGIEQGLKPSNPVHFGAVMLNSARNSLEYILKAHDAAKVYLPKYICDVMLEPLKKLNINYEFYGLSKDLRLANGMELEENEFILYVNYFGIMDDYCDHLVEEYGDRLIVDASQAFYYESPGTHTIYSPRKFLGVSDGGMLYSDRVLGDNIETDVSWERASHLLKRIDVGAEEGYSDFVINDKSLINQPIKQMSNLTKAILNSTDHEVVKKKRLSNFNMLAKALNIENGLRIDGEIACPMVYPLLTNNKNIRSKLIKERVFVATYWPNIFEWSKPEEVEYRLAENIIPLPIDQRYGQADMERIIELISGS
jgi:hypothetical protein